jgi:cyclase
VANFNVIVASDYCDSKNWLITQNKKEVENQMSDYKAPAAEMKELCPGVYAYIQPKGWFQNNTGLIVGDKEAIVVDSLTNKSMVENFISKIKTITKKPVRFLINTHMHGDHIYTNHYFPDATVISSSRCREVTKKTDPHEIELMKTLFPQMSFEDARITPQDMTFEKKLTIYHGEREIQIIDLGPGHSPSDVIVYLPKEKLVFCGDLLMNGSPQQTMGGSISLLIQNLDYLASLDVNMYVPGHGPVSKRDALYTMREYLIVIREESRKCFDKGMTWDQAAETIDIGKFKDWGNTELNYPNCARAYSEFRGEELACELPIMEIVPKMVAKMSKK